MSNFPPPPNRFPPPPGAGGGFAPPPPGAGGGFAPPPPGVGGGFAPPPPGAGGGFAPPPPPNRGGFAPPPPNGGGFAPPPAPGQQQPGPFAPPPPGHNVGMQQLNVGMNKMSMQPPSPAMQAGPGPSMFNPNASASGFHAQPPPAANGSGPQMFHAQVPGAGGPPQPQMMAVPQPGAAQSANSNFYPTPQTNSQMAAPVGANSPGQANAAPALLSENIDYSITIPDHLIRWATGKLPQTQNHANIMKVPMGAVLRPLAPDISDDEQVDTVQPSPAGIVRCKRCRTYMNAFVSWSEHGRRWRCNICGQTNDTPSAYFCHLDEQGLRRDRFERPELCKGVVEFIAPPEYMVRPPQEPSYFFVIDVSATAVRSGMVAATARSIKASLDELPGRGRTKIGFITFDNGVHYYNLSSGLSSPQMLVVSDLKELFVPLPDDLLVNLEESRAVVETFLDNLPDMFAKNPVVSQSCLGPALKAAFTVMKQIGGKMCVFQSMIPNLGDGALRPREKPGFITTANEMKMLIPDTTWYKDTAIEFSKQQISVDMYLFPYQYLDFAALGELPKYTAGSLHSYPFFNQSRDSARFETQLNKCLTQTTAFEAVMRIRCTKGMRITNFYGNFYIRGTDLLALPNCNTDSVFAFDLAHDEQALTCSHMTVQAALLYTSSDGERRIRVMTQALPVSGLISDVIKSIDVDTTCALLAKQALDMGIKSTLDNARMKLQQICVDTIRASKSGDKRTVSGYTAPPAPGQHGAEDESKPIPENLRLLPLYTLALMKNVAFRGGTDVHPDERVQSHHTLNNLWVDQSKKFIYPRMFSIHNMDSSMGLSGDENCDPERVAGHNNIILPEAINLSVERLSSDGVFLLDNGLEMYLWVGRTANMSIVTSLFGVHTLDDIDPNILSVNTSGDDFSSRFGAIVQALCEDPADPYVLSPKINVVREGDPNMEGRFFWFMIEDRASFQGGTYSYDEFMHFVQNPNASAGGGRAAPPGPPGQPTGPRGPVVQGQNVGGMPPPQNMGMPPPQNMGMPPPQNMGMPPPQNMGMPPPQNMGMPPPQNNMGMPPGSQQHRQGMQMPPTVPGSNLPPQGHGMPPPHMPNQAASQPPSYNGPPSGPPAGPPQNRFGQSPQSAPPNIGRSPNQVHPGGAPPPHQPQGMPHPPGPPGGAPPVPHQPQGMPHPPGPPGGLYGAPQSRQGGMPPPHAAPGPPPPGPPRPGNPTQRMAPPPPHRGNMPPPPPTR